MFIGNGLSVFEFPVKEFVFHFVRTSFGEDHRFSNLYLFVPHLIYTIDLFLGKRKKKLQLN